MKTTVLEFEDFEGSVTVRVQPVAVGDLFEVLELLEGARTADAYRALAEKFAPFVEAWTYPEKPNAAGVLKRDINHLWSLVTAWRDGVRDAPLPLPRRSSSSDQSADGSP